MTTETLEELRERLLRRQDVQQMIQARAYEIYKMRGGKPGGEAQDWFHAESEVLAFLIAGESTHSDEQAESEPAEAASASNAPPESPAAKKPKPRGGPDSKQPPRKAGAPKRVITKKPAKAKAKPE